MQKINVSFKNANYWGNKRIDKVQNDGSITDYMSLNGIFFVIHNKNNQNRKNILLKVSVIN